VSYFRPQQAGKIGPRTIQRFPDSTSRLSQKAGQVIVLFLTLIGVLAGAGAGRRKAFMLKLQAQQILCQRQTEINTRK